MKAHDSKHFWLKTVSKPHFPKLFKGSVHIDDQTLLMVTLLQGKINVLKLNLSDFSLLEKFSLNVEECKRFDPHMLHSQTIYFHKRIYFILNAEPKEQEHIMIGDLSYKKLFPITNGNEGPSLFRFNYSATLYGFSILLFGGINENLECQNVMDSFDIITYTWKNFKTKGKPPPPRHSHSSFVHEDNFFVLGGTNSSDFFEKEMLFEDFYVLNMSSLSWTPIKTSGNIPKSIAFNYVIDYTPRSVIILWCDRQESDQEFINCSLLDVVNYEWSDPLRYTESPPFRNGAAVTFDTSSKILYFCGGFSFTNPEETCFSKEIDRLLINEDIDTKKATKGLSFYKDEKINLDTSPLRHRLSSTEEKKFGKSESLDNFEKPSNLEEDLTFEELLAREKQMMQAEKSEGEAPKKKSKKKKKKK